MHLGPTAVAADADGIVLVHSGEEGEPGMRKITRSGDRHPRLRAVRHATAPDATPRRVVHPPFTDTFASDGFWYGDAGGSLRFDVCQPDGAVVPGVNAAGDTLFASVNSNAGEAGRAESYPGTAWRIAVGDHHRHVLTLFSAAKGAQSAKERISLRTASGETAAVDYDGAQGGVIVQFGLVGEATLSVQQNVRGIGSSPCGANAVALFLD